MLENVESLKDIFPEAKICKLGDTRKMHHNHLSVILVTYKETKYQLKKILLLLNKDDKKQYFIIIFFNTFYHYLYKKSS